MSWALTRSRRGMGMRTTEWDKFPLCVTSVSQESFHIVEENTSHIWIISRIQCVSNSWIVLKFPLTTLASSFSEHHWGSSQAMSNSHERCSLQVYVSVLIPRRSDSVDMEGALHFKHLPKWVLSSYIVVNRFAINK